MDTYKTSIVAIKFTSSIVFVIDSRMTLVDYSDVATNMCQKIIQIDGDAEDANKRRFAFVAFSGDTPLLRQLKKSLPVDPKLKANLTVAEVTARITEGIRSKIRRERVFYGIVVIGIGEGDTLQINLIRTVDWTKEERENNPVSKQMKMNIVLKENVEDVCVAGTGTKWLQTYFKNRFFPGLNWDGDVSFNLGRKVLDIPLDMSPSDAQKLAMDALEYGVHRNVGTGGLLHGFHISKTADVNDQYGEFKLTPFYRKQEDYYHCKSEYVNWPTPDEPPVFDEDD